MSTTQKKKDDQGKGTLGQRLRDARLAAGLSQRKLAFPGCTAAYISRIETEQRTPSRELLESLASRLGVGPRYLATGEEGAEPIDPLMEAELALRFDETTSALELFERALASASVVRERARALAGLGRLAYRDGDMTRAKECLEEARAIDAQADVDPEGVIDTLGRCYSALGEDTHVLALYEEALRKAEDREDFRGRMKFGILLANQLIDSGDLDRAARLLGKALADSAETRDPLPRARLYWSESRLQTARGDHDRAADYARKALELVELTEDNQQLAGAHQLLAHVEIARGRPQEGLVLLEGGMELLGDSGHEAVRARFRLEQAHALAGLGRAEEAASLAMEAAGVLTPINPLEAGRGFQVVADALYELGERARARELYELAVELLSQRSNRYLAAAYVRLAELLEEDGHAIEALGLLKKALAIQAQVGQR